MNNNTSSLLISIVLTLTSLLGLTYLTLQKVGFAGSDTLLWCSVFVGIGVIELVARFAMSKSDDINKAYKKLSNILEKINVKVMLLDPEQQVIYINPLLNKALRLWSISIEVGNNCQFILQEYGVNHDLSHSIDAESKEIEINDSFIELHSTPLINKNNKLYGYLVEWNDTTREHLFASNVERISDYILEGNLQVSLPRNEGDGIFGKISNKINKITKYYLNLFTDVIKITESFQDIETRSVINSKHHQQSLKIMQKINHNIDSYTNSMKTVQKICIRFYQNMHSIYKYSIDVNNSMHSQKDVMMQVKNLLKDSSLNNKEKELIMRFTDSANISCKDNLARISKLVEANEQFMYEISKLNQYFDSLLPKAISDDATEIEDNQPVNTDNKASVELEKSLQVSEKIIEKSSHAKDKSSKDSVDDDAYDHSTSMMWF